MSGYELVAVKQLSFVAKGVGIWIVVRKSIAQQCNARASQERTLFRRAIGAEVTVWTDVLGVVYL